LPQTTLQTRIQGHDDVLDALSDLMNRVERGLHRELCAGRKWTGDLAVSFYKRYGISAKLMESAYAARQAKVDASVELAKIHVLEVGSKHAAKVRQIAKKSTALAKARKKIVETAATVAKAEAKAAKLQTALNQASDAKRSKALQQLKSLLGVMHRERNELGALVEKTRRLKADIHQHKRRAGILEHTMKVDRQRVDDPTLCFGTKKLFKAQFHLKENGFASHEEWREAWTRSRSATFMIEGAAASPAGNQFARLKTRDDGLFDLELRLPEALAHLAQESLKWSGRTIPIVRMQGLRFEHRSEELASALERGISVAVRFHRDERGWRVMPSFKPVEIETQFYTRCGAVGVDLNAGHVSVTRADRFGNPVEQFDVPLVTYGKSEGAARSATGRAVKAIVTYAALHDLPVVSEKLDFSDKKKRLNDERSAHRARQLSSFAYSAFAAALESACARQGVALRRVNPAYTSIIGRVKTARRYGSSVHAAASLAIARRAMELSEQLPKSSIDARSLRVPMDDAHLVTLDLPARKDPGAQDAGTRHVWSDWNRVAKSFRDALAALRPSGRKRPSRSTLGRGELRSMVGRSGRAVPGSSIQSRTTGTVRAMTA
jgi:IS605 OrfB family transposase